MGGASFCVCATVYGKRRSAHPPRRCGEPRAEQEDLRAAHAGIEIEQRDGHLPVEAGASGGAGVYVQCAVSFSDERLVAVPVDDDVLTSRRPRIDDAVHEVDPRAAEDHIRKQRQPQVLQLAIVVAGDRRQRRDRRQLRQHVLGTDVARVQYRLNAPKRRRDARVQEAVRVRDEPDEHASIIVGERE